MLPYFARAAKAAFPAERDPLRRMADQLVLRGEWEADGPPTIRLVE